MTDRVCPRCGEEDCALERSEHETAMRDASSNSADEPTTECCGTHIDDGTCFWCGKAVDAVGRVIPNSVAEASVSTYWKDHLPDATPNSVSITVSEETADWITAKAIEHGCTEDEVIATLIADWNEAVDG